MTNLFLIVVFTLIKVWAVGFFWFHLSGINHMLPAIAIFALLIFIYKKSLLNKGFKATGM